MPFQKGRSGNPAGKPKGVKNRKTRAMLEECERKGETPLAYMLRVMRNKKAPRERRDEMAKAAAPYLHPKLSSVDMVVDADVTHKGQVGREPISTDDWESKHGADGMGATNGAATRTH